MRWFESCFLGLFFVLLLVLGPANIFDHQLQHSFPYGYGASDAFWHQVYTDDLKQAGNFRYYAPYYSGGFENVIAINPPLLYHLAVQLSVLTGLEVYDTLYLLVFILAIFSAVLVYILIRKFNQNVAYLSLPIMVLVFSGKFKVAYLFGTWIYVGASFFLIALVWAVDRFELNKSFLLITFFFSAVTLTHSSETVFAVLFMGLFYVVYCWFHNKIDIGLFKCFGVSAVLSFIICFYYLVILKYGWGRASASSAFQILTLEQWTGSQAPAITDFGWLLPVIFAGMLLLLWNFFSSKNKHTQRFSIVIFASFFMFFMGFSNYVGFGHRAFQTRYFWPLYTAVFFGIVIYTIIKFISTYYFSSETVIPIVAFILLLIFSFSYYEKQQWKGLLDDPHWQAFTWIRTSTQPHEKVYFFYGDPYSQNALLANIWRLAYVVQFDDFIAALQQRKVKRSYGTDLVGEYGAGLPYRTAFFDFGYYRDEQPELFKGQRDICVFEYWVFDKASYQPVLAQYNLLIREQLLKFNATEVFSNSMVSILKNNNVNKTCMVEGGF